MMNTNAPKINMRKINKHSIDKVGFLQSVIFALINNIYYANMYVPVFFYIRRRYSVQIKEMFLQ